MYKGLMIVLIKSYVLKQTGSSMLICHPLDFNCFREIRPFMPFYETLSISYTVFSVIDALWQLYEHSQLLITIQIWKYTKYLEYYSEFCAFKIYARRIPGKYSWLACKKMGRKQSSLPNWESNLFRYGLSNN